MAITTAMCTSFKGELLGGTHDLDTHTLKIALIKASPSGTYGAATTNYSDVTGNSDESSGTNYSAGGQNLDGATISTTGTTAIVDFTDEVFTNVTTRLTDVSSTIRLHPTRLSALSTLVVQYLLPLVILQSNSLLQTQVTL